MTPTEQQRAVNVLVRDTLVKAGWNLVRDNEPGGTLVLEGDGLSIVGGFHAYPIKTPVQNPNEAVTVTSENLVPALPEGAGKAPVAWVILHEGGDFWSGEEWTDMLSDGARLYTDEEKFDLTPEFLGDDRLDSGWVHVYMHEVDGTLTTEPCEGKDVCQDCLDVRRSVGEVDMGRKHGAAWVASFMPPEGEGGVGGFEWRETREEVEAIFAEWVSAPDQTLGTKYEVWAVTDVDLDDRDGTTGYIDVLFGDGDYTAIKTATITDQITPPVNLQGFDKTPGDLLDPKKSEEDS